MLSNPTSTTITTKTKTKTSPLPNAEARASLPAPPTSLPIRTSARSPATALLPCRWLARNPNPNRNRNRNRRRIQEASAATGPSCEVLPIRRVRSTLRRASSRNSADVSSFTPSFCFPSVSAVTCDERDAHHVDKSQAEVPSVSFPTLHEITIRKGVKR